MLLVTLNLVLVQILVPLVGLVGVGITLIGLPGSWLTLASAAAAEMLTEERLFSTGTLVAATAMAVAGELIEFLAGSRGARAAGASRIGALGALVGGVLGALVGTFLLPIPVVGTVLGGALGAFALSAMVERGEGRPMGEALGVGKGAAVGHTLGLLGKLVMGLGVFLVVAIAVIWP